MTSEGGTGRAECGACIPAWVMCGGCYRRQRGRGSRIETIDRPEDDALLIGGFGENSVAVPGYAVKDLGMIKLKNGRGFTSLQCPCGFRR